jgi:hypothetical protein
MVLLLPRQLPDAYVEAQERAKVKKLLFRELLKKRSRGRLHNRIPESSATASLKTWLAEASK